MTNTWPNFILIICRIKENKHKCSCFHYAAMYMLHVTNFEICRFQKTKNSKHLENETLFFLQIKKVIN